MSTLEAVGVRTEPTKFWRVRYLHTVGSRLFRMVPTTSDRPSWDRKSRWPAWRSIWTNRWARLGLGT